jgi:hypothetical protein
MLLPFASSFGTVTSTVFAPEFNGLNAVKVTKAVSSTAKEAIDFVSVNILAPLTFKVTFKLVSAFVPELVTCA